MKSIAEVIGLHTGLQNEAAKSEYIDQDATLVDYGSGLVGNMSWETPYMKFVLDDGRKVKWQSDDVEHHPLYWERNKKVHIRAFLRPDGYTLFRVEVVPIGPSKKYDRFLNNRMRNEVGKVERKRKYEESKKNRLASMYLKDIESSLTDLPYPQWLEKVAASEGGLAYDYLEWARLHATGDTDLDFDDWRNGKTSDMDKKAQQVIQWQKDYRLYQKYLKDKGRKKDFPSFEEWKTNLNQEDYKDWLSKQKDTDWHRFYQAFKNKKWNVAKSKFKGTKEEFFATLPSFEEWYKEERTYKPHRGSPLPEEKAWNDPTDPKNPTLDPKGLHELESLVQFAEEAQKNPKSFNKDEWVKMLGDGNMKLPFATWSLPCKATCPMSTEFCRKWCYSVKAWGLRPSVRGKHMANYVRSKMPFFVKRMTNDVLNRSEKGDKIVRIHVDGDFYDQKYLDKWKEIMRNVYKEDPSVRFSAYSKRADLDWSNLPPNFRNILSEDPDVRIPFKGKDVPEGEQFVNVHRDEKGMAHWEQEVRGSTPAKVVKAQEFDGNAIIVPAGRDREYVLSDLAIKALSQKHGVPMQTVERIPTRERKFPVMEEAEKQIPIVDGQLQWEQLAPEDVEFLKGLSYYAPTDANTYFPCRGACGNPYLDHDDPYWGCNYCYLNADERQEQMKNPIYAKGNVAFKQH